jgi:hypothetical protein
MWTPTNRACEHACNIVPLRGIFRVEVEPLEVWFWLPLPGSGGGGECRAWRRSRGSVLSISRTGRGSSRSPGSWGSRGTRFAMEQRSDRRPNQSLDDAEACDVWPRRHRPPAGAYVAATTAHTLRETPFRNIDSSGGFSRGVITYIRGAGRMHAFVISTQ